MGAITRKYDVKVFRIAIRQFPCFRPIHYYILCNHPTFDVPPQKHMRHQVITD